MPVFKKNHLNIIDEDRNVVGNSLILYHEIWYMAQIPTKSTGINSLPQLTTWQLMLYLTIHWEAICTCARYRWSARLLLPFAFPIGCSCERWADITCCDWLTALSRTERGEGRVLGGDLLLVHWPGSLSITERREWSAPVPGRRRERRVVVGGGRAGEQDRRSFDSVEELRTFKQNIHICTVHARAI